MFIIIFNIITFSIVATAIIKNNSKTKEKLCGLQIVEVTASSAKNAGLVVGEVIETINGYQVGDMNDLTRALANKRPNDTATVITNTNTYSVILFANPQNPQQVLLGIKLKQTECEK
ncbi:MAG: PDZ domain-containing protein [Candidatus Woesebacteria bacterium]|nr:PDZ domain-containing protein [Candidatus Woesebacteria bacterium]